MHKQKGYTHAEGIATVLLLLFCLCAAGSALYGISELIIKYW
jgi:hypothetical protein